MRSLIVFCAVVMVLANFGTRMLDRLQQMPTQQAMKASTGSDAASAPVSSNSRSVTLRSGPHGHFQVDARIDGRPLNLVIDTGASAVALRVSDAARLGIHPKARDYDVEIRTANGRIKAARAHLPAVEVGNIVVRDVRAIVLPDSALSENLLGMSFLSRLRRYEYSAGKLVLEQ